MGNKNIIEDIVPQKLIDVIEKVKTNLNIINQLSNETNELLRSVRSAEINFSAEIRKDNCIHMFNHKYEGGMHGNSTAICIKCGFKP